MSLKERIEELIRAKAAQQERTNAIEAQKARDDIPNYEEGIQANADRVERTLQASGIVPLLQEVAEFYGADPNSVGLMWTIGDDSFGNVRQLQQYFLEEPVEGKYLDRYICARNRIEYSKEVAKVCGEKVFEVLPSFHFKAAIEVKTDRRKIAATIDSETPKELVLRAGETRVPSYGKVDSKLAPRYEESFEIDWEDLTVREKLADIFVDIVAEGKDALDA